VISSIENLSSEVAQQILFEAKSNGVSVENYLETIAKQTNSNGDKPKVRSVSEKVDLSKSHEWLTENRNKYLGKWVVLDCNKLIGAGDDPRPIVEKARQKGVKVPFVKFIEKDSEPFTGGWL
jgi:hypothetical protein